MTTRIFAMALITVCAAAAADTQQYRIRAVPQEPHFDNFDWRAERYAGMSFEFTDTRVTFHGPKGEFYSAERPDMRPELVRDGKHLSVRNAAGARSQIKQSFLSGDGTEVVVLSVNLRERKAENGRLANEFGQPFMEYVRRVLGPLETVRIPLDHLETGQGLEEVSIAQ